ncbi:MAG: cell division protein ZapA [Gammaproteobacteria bacterium]|nr:cell division protein ZapA [Gammaproteobacteria bacterium]
MSAPSIPVTVSVLDQEFRIGCPEDERDALIASAAYLDKKMREIKRSGRIIGMDKIAVMAALHIAHELLQSRSGGEGEALSRTVDILPAQFKQLQKRVEEELGKSRQIAL